MLSHLQDPLAAKQTTGSWRVNCPLQTIAARMHSSIPRSIYKRCRVPGSGPWHQHPTFAPANPRLIRHRLWPERGIAASSSTFHSLHRSLATSFVALSNISSGRLLDFHFGIYSSHSFATSRALRAIAHLTTPSAATAPSYLGAISRRRHDNCLPQPVAFHSLRNESPEELLSRSAVRLP